MAKNEGATPPEVDASVLTEEALTAAAENAEKALADAADLDALAHVKVEHLGDKSPIALARRGLGSLPGKEKADAGKRVNIFRTRINNAYDARREVLLAERDAHHRRAALVHRLETFFRGQALVQDLVRIHFPDSAGEDGQRPLRRARLPGR